jgi:hypothetical protein
MIPELNKIYNCFDDGKIRESRKYQVKIIDIIPFNDATSHLKETWEQEVIDTYWLYAKNTDYFIKGCLIESKDDDMFFIRTKDGGWFGLGYWSGRLDVDNSLTNMLNNKTPAN